VKNLLSLAVIAAVVLIAGFAAADAIRGKPREPSAAPTTIPIQTGPTRLPGPQPQAEAPTGWPQGVLRGTLTFADANTCRIRVIGLAGGRERPVARFTSDCQLWAPPVGPRLAYGLGPSSGDGLEPFRLADLQSPNLELGGYRALFGVIVWSQDGQHVAWCGRRRTGFDLEIGGPSQRLPRCPVSFTRDNEVAYAVGDKIIVGDRTLYTASGGITYASFGQDGSLAAVVDGEKIERWDGSALITTTKIPPGYQGLTPTFRYDNCGALFAQGGGVQIFDLGCKPGLPTRSFPGVSATWSPDGAWIAVSSGQSITFYRVVGTRLAIDWPAGASDMVWRPS
jgi:WD40 repeat protein